MLLNQISGDSWLFFAKLEFLGVKISRIVKLTFGLKQIFKKPFHALQILMKQMGNSMHGGRIGMEILLARE